MLAEGVAQPVGLPLPAPALKEEIVRTNTNLLNPRSYWFCLDQGGPEEKRDAYQTMMGDRGFIDSFQAIGRALSARERTRRAGRPANKNLLTLVTLGSSPSDVVAFLTDRELVAEESTIDNGHLGVWWFRERWASALNVEPGGDSRRASLVESEFSLRWVALDMVATQVLCTRPDGDDLASRLIEIIRAAPSVGEKKDARSRGRETVRAVDEKLEVAAAEPGQQEFAQRFTSLGQLRSREYEPPIARRLGRPLSNGLEVRGILKPDIILNEYEPCAVTQAPTADDKAIELAIKRGCHVIEMTAHLQDDLRGLDSYLSEKVSVYAELLESV